MCVSFLRRVAFTILEHVFLDDQEVPVQHSAPQRLGANASASRDAFDCCEQGSVLQSTCSPKRNRGKSLSSARVRTGSGLLA